MPAAVHANSVPTDGSAVGRSQTRGRRPQTRGWVARTLRSQPAIKRIREAVSEIKKAARKDKVLAADGAVVFLQKLSPALGRPAHRDLQEGVEPGPEPTWVLPGNNQLPGRVGRCRALPGAPRAAVGAFVMGRRYGPVVQVEQDSRGAGHGGKPLPRGVRIWNEMFCVTHELSARGMDGQ